MPDSVESRLGRLEREAAALGQRVSDLSTTVERLIPLSVQITRVESAVGACDEDIAAVHVLVDNMRKSLTDRDERDSRDRRNLRVALIGLTGVIGAALIAAIATIVAAGLS